MKLRNIPRLAALFLLASLAAPWAAPAQTAKPGAEDVRAQLEQQEQRIRILERKLDLAQDDAKDTAATAPKIKASPSGVSIASADGTTVIKFRGSLNVDWRNFYSDYLPNGSARPPGNDTFLLRLARPYVEGSLGKLIDFRFMPDFGGGKTIIQDAYVTAKFQPFFALTAGKFKSPVGLEFLQADADVRYIERALPTKLVPARDIGIQLTGDLLGSRLGYQLAYVNGSADGSASDSNTTPDTDNNDQKDWVLRLFSVPFKRSYFSALRGLGIGIGGTWVRANGQVDATGAATNSLLPSYKTNGQQTWFSYRGGTTPTLAYGERLRLSPQAYYYLGSFGLLTEYVQLKQGVRRVVSPALTRDATLTHKAWQVSASWFLTGEDEGYRFPAPKRPYTIGGPGWGALELNARIAALDIDDAAFAGGANSFANPAGSASKATAYTAGVTWALTQNFKTLLDFEQTRFKAGAAGGADAPTEKILFTRFSLNY